MAARQPLRDQGRGESVEGLDRLWWLIPYAVIVSENDFGRSVMEKGIEVRHIPIYAAHCLGDGCVTTS